MAGVIRLNNNIFLKRILQTSFVNGRRISTSNKNSDTASTSVSGPTPTCTKSTEKNWVSYGFDFKDEAADRRATHSIFFFSVTMCIVFGGFVYAYMPDYQYRDWAQREAYLEIRRRECLGIPLIDPNLIDPKKITLPDDDELGDTEIII